MKVTSLEKCCPSTTAPQRVQFLYQVSKVSAGRLQRRHGCVIGSRRLQLSPILFELGFLPTMWTRWHLGLLLARRIWALVTALGDFFNLLQLPKELLVAVNPAFERSFASCDTVSRTADQLLHSRECYRVCHFVNVMQSRVSRQLHSAVSASPMCCTCKRPATLWKR